MPTKSFDFTGADGDPIPSGLTAESGTFEIETNRLAPSGGGPGGPGWVAIESTASDADATITATMRAVASDGSTGGVVFRYSDNDNFWMAVVHYGQDDVRLFRRQGGSFANLGAAGVAGGINVDDVISVELSGDDITVKHNGSTTHTRNDSFNNTANRHGIRFGTSDHRADDLSIVYGSSDVTAPVLTSPTGTETGTTTASGTVSTDEANGSLDAVVTTSSTAPSASQIQAGQDHTGSAAAATDLNNTVSATGVQNVSFTGLTASTTYHVHYVHQDAAGNDSNVVSSASFTTDAAPSGTVSVTEAPAQDFTYQRGAAVAFTGTYTGSPTALQYRVLDASDDSEIVTWATFDASPSGGTFTLSFTPPTTTAAMYVEVRFSNDAGVIDAQSIDWRYGIRAIIYGQSLANNLWTQGSITPPSGYVFYDGTTFSAPTQGSGLNAMAQKLIDMYGCSVCLSETAEGGTQMVFEPNSNSNHWASATSTLFSDTVTRVSGMTNSEQTLEFALFIQGNRDALNDIPENDYLRINHPGGLGDLLRNTRDNWTRADGSTLPVVLGLLGKNTADTDAPYQAIRNAHMHMARADDNVFGLPIFHHGTDDGQHPNNAGDTAMGEDTAVIVAFMNGDTSTNCPDIVSADINAGATEITLEFDTDLLASDTTYSTEGIRVEDAGSPVTVSSFVRETARKAKITVSSAIANTDQITVYLGYGCGTSGGALTYPRSADITLPASAGVYNLPALNARIDLVELAV